MSSADPKRGARLVRAMASSGYTVARLAEETEYSTGTVSNWRKGHEMNTSQIRLVCQILQISADHLLFGSRVLLSELDQKLSGYVQLLPPKQQQAVLNLAADLASAI